ncbi:hypothetical protein [Leyella lascolaii]|nr:hypothetical protein [Leyella lascolaii]
MKISIILNGDSQVETQNLASPVPPIPISTRNNASTNKRIYPS